MVYINKMALKIEVGTRRQYFQFVDQRAFLQKCSKGEKVANVVPEWKQRHFTLAESNYSHWNLGITPPSTVGETYSFRHLGSHAGVGGVCLTKQKTPVVQCSQSHVGLVTEETVMPIELLVLLFVFQICCSETSSAYFTQSLCNLSHYNAPRICPGQ